MNIVEFLQANNANFSIGTSTDRIKYIVIHYVGATGGAMANLRYYHNDVVKASAHYYVDFNGDVYQSVQDKDIAWHCGTSKGYKHPECRNQNSIGIELCVRNKGNLSDTSKDWYFEDATVYGAVKLTTELMQKYNIPLDHVIRHYDVTGKICPNPFVFNHTTHTWEAFKAAIQYQLNYVPGGGAESQKEPLKAGWLQENGIWKFYLGNTGTCIRNDWYHDVANDKWYWFDASGAMITNQWYQYKDRWYYLGSDGAMVKGEQTINGEWFYFYESGEMCEHSVILTAADNGALKFAGLANQ